MIKSPFFAFRPVPRQTNNAGRIPVRIVCLDLEGVLVPEIWIRFASARRFPSCAAPPATSRITTC